MSVALIDFHNATGTLVQVPVSQRIHSNDTEWLDYYFRLLTENKPGDTVPESCSLPGLICRELTDPPDPIG